MRRLAAVAGALLLGLWACDTSGLPAEYRGAAVPEDRLSSAEARGRGPVPLPITVARSI